MARSANPLIDDLAIGLIAGRWMVVVGIGIGCDGRADHLDMRRMGAFDDLFIGGEDAMHEGLMCGMRRVAESREAADVVDAFEQDDPTNSGLSKDIAIKVRQYIGSETIGEQVVAADALVENADSFGARIG